MSRWIRNPVVTGVVGLVLGLTIGVSGAGTTPTDDGTTPAAQAADEPTGQGEPTDDLQPSLEPEPPTTEEPGDPEDQLSLSQENAVATAEDYLDFSAFSEKGLIRQLKFEGFSTKDATFAVKYIDPDWNEQAAKMAKDYLEFSSFSRSGLSEQLEFEGFTTAQATYGVNQTGL